MQWNCYIRCPEEKKEGLLPTFQAEESNSSMFLFLLHTDAEGGRRVCEARPVHAGMCGWSLPGAVPPGLYISRQWCSQAAALHSPLPCLAWPCPALEHVYSGLRRIPVPCSSGGQRHVHSTFTTSNWDIRSSQEARLSPLVKVFIFSRDNVFRTLVMNLIDFVCYEGTNKLRLEPK